MSQPTRRNHFLPSADGAVRLHTIVMEHVDPLPVLLILHGGPGSGAAPLLELPAFQALDQSFTTVYFDQRGSGESRYPLSRGLTEEQITSDVKSVADWAKAEYPGRPFFLWGGSFGGLLELLTLKRYPDLAERVVISSPAIYPGDTMLQFFMEANDESGLIPQEVGAVMKTIHDKASLQTALNTSTVCDWLASFPEAPKGAEGLFHSHAMRSWFLSGCDARPIIGELRVPTLFLQGMDDPFCPAQLLLDAVEKYSNPNVSCRTFAPCGHAVFDDCTDSFLQIVTDFYLAD